MKSRAPVFFVVLLLAVLAVPAYAAGPYVGIEAGAVFLSDSTFEAAGIEIGDAKFDTGYGLGLVGGQDFGTWRLEGEFVWRRNDNKEISSAVFGTEPIDGDVSSMALMVNGYYDFRMVSPIFVPYLGVGVGGARVSAKVDEPGVGSVIDDNDLVFAYQLAAGVGFVVNKQITIDLNYKYFATADPSFELIDAGGIKVDAEYKSHNVFLGLRYSF